VTGEADPQDLTISQESIRQLAYEIDLADQTLPNWVKQTEIDTGECEGLTTEEREDLRKLRNENESLKEERKILKSRGLLREEGRGAQ